MIAPVIYRLIPQKSTHFLFILFLLSILANNHSNAQGQWKKITNAPGENNYGVMLLLTDGTVMVKARTGGDYGYSWDILAPDAHGSYINGSWSYPNPMVDDRLYFSSQVLPDGRVYVAGGEYGSGAARGEVYDPIKNTWTSAPPLPKGDTISDGNSVLLPDGRILQALVRSSTGYYGYDNLIYDPVANTYSAGPGAMGSHDESTWVKLPDNTILYVDDYSRNSERYIPATNKWIVDAPLPTPIYDTIIGETGPAFLLPNGKCIFFGANGNTAYYTPSGNSSPGTWAKGPAIPYKRGSPDGCASIMPNGKIIISVSDTPSLLNMFPSPTYFYEFNYVKDSFTEIVAPVGGDTLSGPCFDTHMLNLPDGNILFSYGTGDYYEYVPDGTPVAAGKPAVDSIIKIDCTTYKATGTLFNGISEGSVYGDDWQMSTNYPIIRLTSTDSLVYYTRTTNWNRIGSVMTGSLPDTTTFTLPSALPDGSYMLQVVANGIPSNSVPFKTCGVNRVDLTPVAENKMYVYPNPATGQVAVIFSSNGNNKCDIKFVDMLGQVVKESTCQATAGRNKYTVDINGLAKGIYTVITNDGAAINTTKLTVE